MATFLTIIVLGSISLCFAGQTDGGTQQRMAPLTPVQKLNEILSHQHLPVVQPLPFLGSSNSESQSSTNQKTPCTCGVFLSSQVNKGVGKQPTGYAALMYEQDEPTVCNPLGVKTCINKCLETIAKHLPNSPTIICGAVDRDVYRERAHLFVKNCNDAWINTRLSTGSEYCCKDGQNYKCNTL